MPVRGERRGLAHAGVRVVDAEQGGQVGQGFPVHNRCLSLSLSAATQGHGGQWLNKQAVDSHKEGSTIALRVKIKPLFENQIFAGMRWQRC